MSKKREQARDKRAAKSETPARETAPVGNSGDSVPESGSGGRVGGLPREFGRYRIEKVLGEGAMGMVYLALDTTLGRRVALKIPKFRGEDDADQIKRFHREARSAAALHHRNICPVYDTGEIEGIRYISMSYIDGQPLDKLIDPDEFQPPQLVAVLVRKLALGMQKAHDAGVLHRDLKPSNIIIDTDGEPVLMDFGLAVQFGPSQQSRLTQTGTLLGTPAYMSPEQVEGDPAHIGPPADIYSLGVILYEMLTGDVPFGGSVAAVIGQIVTQQPLRPSELNPKVDRQLQSICLKAMAKQSDDRYESMGDMARALSAVSVASAPSSELKPQPITSADAPIVFDAPPVDSEDEFIEGRCGSCGMINDTSRNFCKACGSALMVPCLSCEVEIGSWEKFCPNCGSNVPDTLKKRRSELDGLAESVKSLRDSHQFDEAIAEAKKICGEEDARFSEICKWAATTIQELSVEQSEWLSRHRRAFKEAESLVSQCHYSQAVDLLEAIPIDLKQAGVYALLAKARQAILDCQVLRKMIESRYKSKQLDGLLTHTELYLELNPHDTGIQSLHQELIDREASQTARDVELRRQMVKAQHLADSGKYEAALKLLRKVNAAIDGTSMAKGKLKQKVDALRRKCRTQLAKLARLKDELQSAANELDGIEFNCPQCKCLLEGDRSNVGYELVCPDCQEKVSVNASTSPSPRIINEIGRVNHLISVADQYLELRDDTNIAELRRRLVNLANASNNAERVLIIGGVLVAVFVFLIVVFSLVANT